MSFVEDVQSNGFAIVKGVLTSEQVQMFQKLMESTDHTSQERGGLRNLLDLPEMRDLSASKEVVSLVHPILGPDAFPVRGIFFDKKDGANWKVPWHQDVTIAVTDRIEVDGYSPWSVKQGVQHVQPPSNVLEAMLTVRLHLDDCPESNGALRVIPKSQHHGKLSQSQTDTMVKKNNGVVCEVKSGGALLMRPLLLHASSAVESPNHRRVIHFDYANVALDGGLQWREHPRAKSF
jgi:ectoine hydroxylase-related dioxygenase (phytanoyl-CoA dioxygenase family)